MKAGKKVLVSFLAAALILTMVFVPGAVSDAKSTKYNAGKVYLAPSYIYGDTASTKWKSVPKKRLEVYSTGYMYVYYGALTSITDVKVNKNGLVAKALYTGTSYGRRYGEIGLQANKPGTYKVSFKINGVKKCSFTVFAYNVNSVYKTVKFGGQTVYKLTGSYKKGVQTIKGIEKTKIKKKSGRLKVTPGSGYKITGIVVTTSNGKKGAITAKAYRNGANIKVSKKPSYSNYSNGNSSKSEKKYTGIYISYKDTKYGSYVKYSVTKKHGTTEIKRVYKDMYGNVSTSYSLPSTGGGSFQLWSF